MPEDRREHQPDFDPEEFETGVLTRAEAAATKAAPAKAAPAKAAPAKATQPAVRKRRQRESGGRSAKASRQATTPKAKPRSRKTSNVMCHSPSHFMESRSECSGSSVPMYCWIW